MMCVTRLQAIKNFKAGNFLKVIVPGLSIIDSKSFKTILHVFYKNKIMYCQIGNNIWKESILLKISSSQLKSFIKRN